MKEYIEYMNNISVDDALHEKILRKTTHKTPLPKRTGNLFRYTAMAACAVIVLFCVWTMPHLINNPNDRQDFEPLFTGLPVDNFSLADIDSGIMAYRIAYRQLSDFFSQYNSVPDMFAFVKVLDTEQVDETPRYSASSNIRQNSSVQVLSVIWNRDGGTPETLSVTQYLSGGCCADEPTNLLREGGVYLLPLIYYGGNINTWRIASDLDVLFEVDDKGCIWSHSAFENFQSFDGGDARILAEAITVFTSDENFSAAVSRFGLIVRGNWAILMEVTHLSVTSDKDAFNSDCYEHTFRVDGILSTAAESMPHPAVGDEIKVKSYYQITQIHLEQGGRYLIFYNADNGGQPQIEPGLIAKINDDGTITEIFTPPNYSHRAFEGYNGFTVEQMKEEAERAKAWHEAHAKNTSE